MSDNAVNAILSGIDLNALARQVGASPAEVEDAVQVALPTLLGSLQANAAEADGKASLIGALGQHTGELSLDQVDTEDGRRILGHAFADDPSRLGALAGKDGGLLAKLLPILAPIVMNWLANNLLGGGTQTKQSSGGGDLLGDLLGGLLGGGSSSGGTGDLLGDLLGGLVGGGKAATPAQKQTQPASNGGDLLGDLLGQILGR